MQLLKFWRVIFLLFLLFLKFIVENTNDLAHFQLRMLKYLRILYLKVTVQLHSVQLWDPKAVPQSSTLIIIHIFSIMIAYAKNDDECSIGVTNPNIKYCFFGVLCL